MANLVTSINTTFNIQGIDIEGIRSQITPHCVICKMEKDTPNGPVLMTTKERDACAYPNKCLFKRSSPQEGAEKRKERGLPPIPSRFGVREHLSEYGLPKAKLSNYGKHQIFMMLHYPEMGFGYPRKLPDFDIFGRINSLIVDPSMILDYKDLKKFKVDMHHINKQKWDDRKENLAMVINTEHTRIENITNTRHLHRVLNAIAKRNLMFFGSTMCPTYR
jgi:hypothetical protein